MIHLEGVMLKKEDRKATTVHATSRCIATLLSVPQWHRPLSDVRPLLICMSRFTADINMASLA